MSKYENTSFESRIVVKRVEAKIEEDKNDDEY